MEGKLLSAQAPEPIRKLNAKLGAVLFQLPPNFKKDIARLSDLLTQFPSDVRAACEFRHASWLDESHRVDTISFLRELGAVHTVVDGPQGFANSVPLLAETTHPDYALVRLHARAEPANPAAMTRPR